VTIQEIVIRQGISSDAVYVGRLIRDLTDPKCASFGPVVSICMTPYLSLFAHESYRKRSASDPALSALMSSDVEEIITRSRHTLKLFEDNQRWVDGQITYFRDEILPMHTNYFLGKIRFPPARVFMKDLGLFSYDKKLIVNSHGATFYMGIEPEAWFTNTAEAERAVYEKYVRIFHHLGARLDSGDATFILSLDPQLFNQEIDDVRADRYYPSVFDGPQNTYLNAVLSVFRGMMNFVNSVIVAGARANDIDYTVFKIRFLTLYSVLESLKRLRAEQQSHRLAPRSVSFIDRIVDTAETQTIIARSAKPFRNTLMHYNLDPRVDVARVDVNQPLFGLVPIYFPSYDVAAFAAMVDQCINEVASKLEEWAGA
jgi:hypothetical protein